MTSNLCHTHQIKSTTTYISIREIWICQNDYEYYIYNSNVFILLYCFSVTDVNECLDQEMPACDQICINEEGTHKCACQAGYVLSLDGRSCKVGGSKFHLKIQS